MKELDAELSVTELLHTRYRVRLVRGRGVITEEGLWSLDRAHPIAWDGAGARAALVVMLSGRVRARIDGAEQWAEGGELLSTSPLGACQTREEGRAFTQLCVEWDTGFLGTRDPAALSSTRLGPSTLALLDSAAAVLGDAAATQTTTAGHLAEVLSALRAEGAPFDAVAAGDLVEPSAPGDADLAVALGAALSSMGDGPQIVDLEAAMGLSTRQLSRRVAAFAGRYGLNGTNWRSMRDRWRLNAGSSVMSHPQATTCRVGRALGYGSSEAFCHAFARAGLPAPRNIRDAVRGLL